jgi:hypothetical protein
MAAVYSSPGALSQRGFDFGVRAEMLTVFFVARGCRHCMAQSEAMQRFIRTAAACLSCALKDRWSCACFAVDDFIISVALCTFV